MPKAIVSTTVAANPGVRARLRAEYRRSLRTPTVASAGETVPDGCIETSNAAFGKPRAAIVR